MLSAKKYLEMGQTILSNGLMQYYHHLKLTDDEFLVLLQLFYFQQQGNFFPIPEEIAENTGKEVDRIYQLLIQLQEKQMIQLETLEDENHMKYDQYDLTLVWSRLAELLNKKNQQQTKLLQQNKIRELYQTFQQEFARGLSPMELEMLGQWLEVDHYSTDLILLALKEAVLNQAYSLKYIDRILLSWDKKNIRTKEAVLKEQNQRKNQTKKQVLPEEELPTIPFVPWLKGKEES